MIISVYGATCLDLHTFETIDCTFEREPAQPEPAVGDCFSMTDFHDDETAFSRSLKILEVDLLFQFDSDVLPF